VNRSVGIGVITLYNANREWLVGVMTRWTGSPDIAEDVVQELFLRLFSRGEFLEIRTSTQGYLLASARRLFLDYVKHQAVVARSDGGESMGCAPASPDDAAYEREIDQILQECISVLPTRCREAYRLSREEGLTYAEVARRMRVSEKTAEKHITKGRRLLQSLLRQRIDWEGGGPGWVESSKG